MRARSKTIWKVGDVRHTVWRTLTISLQNLRHMNRTVERCVPHFNGYYWCAEIRKVSKVPIIFISSASDNMNIVMAMNMGGDDFITKPFDLGVLTAKVQAMLRRTYDFAGQSELLENRGAVLNIGSATLTYRGVRIDLSKNEF